jgi:hypothetical protein
VSNPLDTFGTVTLDASGNGSLTLAPEAFQVWTITSINVRTDQSPTQTPVPQCTVYLGSAGPGNIVSQTWMGNRSTAGGSPLVVQPNQPLIVSWENGVAGSVATVSINGTMAMR